ncbi:hypothetical protein phiOC_p187 [Ochrobactrum phage vB_OspM_OC]|nr:hypothetical protein phiOC_p187 [Ochrobactrum phage vB_OspM_OC]
MKKRIVECWYCYGYGQMISGGEMFDETCPECDGYAFLYKCDDGSTEPHDPNGKRK